MKLLLLFYMSACVVARTRGVSAFAFAPPLSRPRPVTGTGTRPRNLVTRPSMVVTPDAVVDTLKPMVSAVIEYSPFLITYGVVLAILNRSQFGSGSGMGLFGGGDSPGVMEKDHTVTLDDVAGIEYVKTEIEEIISFLKNPGSYAEIGARIPRGVLLSSPPGCGKTMLARAISSSASVPLISANGAEFVSIFVGNGPKRVRELFKTARDSAPCVLFIDEIDAIGGERGSSINGNDEREATLNQILTEMDGFERNEGVIVVGATNRPNTLDPALVRSGRMDRKIEISLPRSKERLSILGSHASTKVISDEVDLDKVAKQSPGFSGADLSNLLNEAAILAVRNNRTSVSTRDVDEAFDKMTIGIRLVDAEVSPETDRVVCIHEAGHALLGALQTDYSRVSRISATPSSSGAGGFTLFRPEEDGGIISYERLCSDLRVLLGGRAAEEVVFGPGKVTTGAYGDLERARQLARNIVTEYSMGGLVAYTGDVTEQKVVDLLNNSYMQAMEAVAMNSKVLKQIANALMVRRELSEDEFYDILSSSSNVVVE